MVEIKKIIVNKCKMNPNHAIARIGGSKKYVCMDCNLSEEVESIEERWVRADEIADELRSIDKIMDVVRSSNMNPHLSNDIDLVQAKLVYLYHLLKGYDTSGCELILKQRELRGTKK